MEQLLLSVTGSDRDPTNAMRWLGTSTAHLFALRDGTLAPLSTAPVGCNAMSASQLPSTTLETPTMVLTDMADVRGAGVGGVTLFTVSAATGVALSAGSAPRAGAGGRSPCAVAVCPQSATDGTALIAVACYEGAGEDSDGVVSVLSAVSDARGWSFVLPAGQRAPEQPAPEWGAPLCSKSHSDIGGATPGDGRQDAAHPHGVTWWCESGAERILLVCDLGANAVVAYGVDAATGQMERRGLCRLHLGAGPRHSVLLPPSTDAARTLVVVNELDNTIVAIALRRVGPSGSSAIEMTLCGAPISTLPADFDAW